jgi:hypothetical protein
MDAEREITLKRGLAFFAMDVEIHENVIISAIPKRPKRKILP